jgi:hypothetical protein
MRLGLVAVESTSAALLDDVHGIIRRSKERYRRQSAVGRWHRIPLTLEISKDYKTNTIICSDHNRPNVHAREFQLRLGFSSYDEQMTRNWHRQ